MSGFLGEFFGTMTLLAFGTGVGASISLNKAFAKGSSWLFVSLAWGLAIAFGVYVAGAFGSEGHINPAITIGLAAFGKLPAAQVLPYLAGQILGAFVGAGLVLVHFFPHFKETKAEEGNNVGVFATGPAIKNNLFNFLSEFIATFFFIFTLLHLGDFTDGLKPLIVGLLIAAIGMSFGSTTGFAVNPARDFGPRLAYALLPVPNKTNANWAYAWVPVLGPICGGLLAAGLTALVG